MLRTIPNRLRLLTRHALPQHQPPLTLGPQQLRGAVAATGPSPLRASLCRLSQPHQWRAFHATRARSSEKKPSFFADEDKLWGAITYEPIADESEIKKFSHYFFCILVAYVASFEVSARLPFRTNPNHLLKESLEIVNKDLVVTTHLGAPITGQGERVYAWHQVESVKLTGKDGKPSRLRIKYYLTGPKGTATVFAEVVEGTAKGEYNYLVVQFDATKEVVAIIDHREHDDHKAEHELKPKDPAASGELKLHRVW